MDRLKRDNFGYSLIELIITIAIISVMLGVVSYSLSLSSGKPADECARKLASVLSQARTTTMGKYMNEITITVSNTEGVVVNEDILIKEGSTSNRKSTVGKSSVTVKYKCSGTSGYVDIPSGGLQLRFNSGTGALTAPTKDGQLIFEISKSGTCRYVIINCLTGKVTVGSSENAADV
jgi:prepilin-type N-terminal cleavage/methylation domain-containing protein